MDVLGYLIIFKSYIMQITIYNGIFEVMVFEYHIVYMIKTLSANILPDIDTCLKRKQNHKNTHFKLLQSNKHI